MKNDTVNVTILLPAEYTINHGERIMIAVVFLVTSILAIGGNLMVLLAVWRSKTLQTMSNAFVVCLSVANLGTGLSLPWSVVGLLSFEGWPFSSYVPCSIAGVLLLTSIGASLYSLSGIALNRMLSITAPSDVYQRWFTPNKVAAMIAAIWLVPFIGVLIPPLSGVGAVGYDTTIYTCTDAQHPKLYQFRIVIVVMCYPVTLMAITVSYAIIYITIRRKFRQQKRQCKETANQPSDFDWGAHCMSRKSRLNQQQLSITVNLFVNVCTFLLLNMPFGFALMCSPDNNRTMIFTGMLFVMHSFVHPVLYGLKHPHFKQAFKQMLGISIEETHVPSSGSRITKSDWKHVQRSDKTGDN